MKHLNDLKHLAATLVVGTFIEIICASSAMADYQVTGAGNPAANGTYQLVSESWASSFPVYENNSGTAFLGLLNGYCYIWYNDGSANPAAAPSLYYDHNANPTNGTWVYNPASSRSTNPPPTVAYIPSILANQPEYLVTGAGNPAANGIYQLVSESWASSFPVYENNSGTAFLGLLNGYCYIWYNDGSANPAAAQVLYYNPNANPTNGTWVFNPASSRSTNPPPIVAILLPNPKNHTATATATATNSFVIGITITDQGLGYTNTPLVRFFGGGGSGAGAYAVVSNGLVTSITLTNAGFGYTNAPLVFIEPPLVFNPVLGIAPMSFLVFSNLTVGGTYQLQKSAAWYWTNQPANFTASNVIYTQMVAGAAGSANYRLALTPVPAQAFATSVINFGFVVHANITSGGSGYVTSPAVTIVGGGGTNAAAVSQTSGGVVTNIVINNPGTGYTGTPIIKIDQPPAAAVSPAVSPVMRLDSSLVTPFHSYQIQFIPALGGTWGNWNNGLFSPTDATNSQYVFITNGTGFFRLQYVP